MSFRVLDLRVLGALLAGTALCACAHRPADDPADPLEPVNRAVFRVNDTADRYLLRPVAKGYVQVVPQVARTGVHNFLDNLFYPKTIVNDVFQGKFTQSLSDLGRLLLNTTAGLGGLIDVASDAGLSHHDEDFGQTLGTWGVGEGWFLMLPLFGPSTNRDFVGKVVDIPLSPTFWLDGDHDWLSYTINGISVIDLRAGLLSADSLLDQQFDKYLFIRTAYLQKRWGDIYDGNPPLEDLPNFDEAPAGNGDTPPPTQAPKQ